MSAAGNLDALAGEGGDPRLHPDGKAGDDYIAPQMRRLHDPDVTFEEYYHYAQLSRAEENSSNVKTREKGIMAVIFPKKGDSGAAHDTTAEKNALKNNLSSKETRMHISDEEWINANRAVRLASTSACFYLITTDILGPFALPYAIATTGWGPGIGVYTAIGFLAGYSGYLIWKMFLDLDSYQFPLKHYGDLAFRLYGPWVAQGFNILQSVQLLCNVGILIVQNGLSMTIVAKFNLCYVACCVIWAVFGFGLGQVRTLAKFGWLANAAIWINVLIIFLSMGVVAHYPPDYTAAQTASAGAAIDGPGGALVAQLPDGSYPPVKTSGGLPITGNFIGSVVGIMNAVYSYGGAMLFPEFMSEMRRPHDFLKAMWGAQAFIYFFYMFFGCFVYGYQGQYTVNPTYQGISNYNWAAALNVMVMVTGLIAAALYGNIGIKVVYNVVFVDVFKAPPINGPKGKWIFASLVPVYWSIAFVVAAAIPNFAGLTSVVAAFCILHFTYTFPPLLYIGYLLKRDSIREGEGFDPATGQVRRSITGFKRFAPSLKKNWWKLAWMLIYTLGALALAGLGAYSSIELLIEAFKVPSVNAFTCHSPLAPATS